MSKYVILFLAILYSGISVSAQDQVNDFEDSDKISIAKIKFEVDNTNLRINDLHVDANNRVLVATDKVLIVTGSGKTDQYLLAGKSINCVTSDKKLNIFAASDSKLYLVDKDKEVKLPVDGISTKDIMYKNGKLWLATDKGLFTYLLSSGNWFHYTSENSKLKSNKINNIKVDDEGVMWIGTEKGYLRIKDDKWELEDKRENIVSSRSNNEGQWMISTGDMWLIDPFNRKYPVGLSKEFYSGKVNDFVIDTKGRVYMASDILVRYNPYTEKVERFGSDVGLLSEKCLSLACDKNNNIWIGTADAGLFTIVFDDIAREQLAVTPLLQQAITCADADNAIIKLSISGGLKPYKYKWSDRSLRGKNPSGVKPGEYAVTVSDKNGAEVVSNISVDEPTPIVIELIENRRISENRKKDGLISLAASGGSGDIAFSWSNGGNGSRLENVAAGTYTAIATDEKGCTAKKVFRVRKEKFIPELDISKVNIGQKLRINELNFSADSTDVEAENFEILDEVYEFLTANKSVKIEIGGHTNTIPPHSYCDELSEKRAKSVKEYIVERGIDPKRVSYKGYGKREPLTQSTSLAGRRKNQRVEVTILSL